jgi:NAD(P)-dependent dehydrogenase (short-subunit alcohol dehydrogenase family)
MEPRRTVILGATGGIGSTLARRLADRGDRLLVAGRDPDRTGALADQLGARSAVVDAGDPATITAAIEDATLAFDGIDGVVNCIGSMLLKPGHVTSDDEFAATLEANLWSAFAAVRAGAKAMFKTGGSIVVTSTAAVRTGLPNHEAIAAAKGGVEGLTRAAAATYAARGIRVNAVAPGLVQTPMTERLTASDASREASLAMHALGRLGQPDDIVSAMTWLLDPANDWVTGQVIGIDGGLGSVRPR